MRRESRCRAPGVRAGPRARLAPRRVARRAGLPLPSYPEVQIDFGGSEIASDTSESIPTTRRLRLGQLPRHPDGDPWTQVIWPHRPIARVNVRVQLAASKGPAWSACSNFVDGPGNRGRELGRPRRGDDAAALRVTSGSPSTSRNRASALLTATASRGDARPHAPRCAREHGVEQNIKVRSIDAMLTRVTNLSRIITFGWGART